MYMIKIMNNGKKVVNNYRPTIEGTVKAVMAGNVFAALYAKVVITNALWRRVHAWNDTQRAKKKKKKK